MQTCLQVEVMTCHGVSEMLETQMDKKTTTAPQVKIALSVVPFGDECQCRDSSSMTLTWMSMRNKKACRFTNHDPNRKLQYVLEDVAPVQGLAPAQIWTSMETNGISDYPVPEASP